MTQKSGYRVTVSFFVPANTNDLTSMQAATSFLGELPEFFNETIDGFTTGATDIEITHKWVNRRGQAAPAKVEGSDG